MFARLVTVLGRPGQIDAGVHYFKDKGLPELRKLAGFKGLYVLVDRNSGKEMLVCLWDSQANLQANDKVVAQLRTKAAEIAGAINSPSYEVFEVAIEPA